MPSLYFSGVLNRKYESRSVENQREIRLKNEENTKFKNTYSLYQKTMKLLGKSFKIQNLFSELLHHYIERNYDVDLEEMKDFFESSILTEEKSQLDSLLRSVEFMNEECLSSIRKDVAFMQRVKRILSADSHKRKIAFANIDFNVIEDIIRSGGYKIGLEPKIREFFQEKEKIVRTISKQFASFAKSKRNDSKISLSSVKKKKLTSKFAIKPLKKVKIKKKLFVCTEPTTDRSRATIAVKDKISPRDRFDTVESLYAKATKNEANEEELARLVGEKSLTERV